MLSRIQVSGFKNLVDVDVHFGPFTCIAGANGVGKSNLFDAIRFLSALADRPLIDAARSVRDESGRGADVRDLFHRVGGRRDVKMSFGAEMIVPRTGVDDLGQTAEATMTFLRYDLVLGYRSGADQSSAGGLEILREELSHIKRGDAHRHLLFPHSVNRWRRTVVWGRRTSPFISTSGAYPNIIIKIHADSGRDSGGRPLSRSAANLPRTVLSIANAAENPTALLARREMQSWRLLQLEPSSLRKPDEFSAPVHIGADGAHLPATLSHLAKTYERRDIDVYSAIGNRLAELLEDIREVRVDRDERREIYTLEVTDNGGTTYSARALSDGSLRFLALAVLEMEEEASGLICLEEPENGIHPERIPAMLALLRDMAVDVDEAVAPGNPLRQVIVNTHSPAVVMQIEDADLLVAERREHIEGGMRVPTVVFAHLPGTWRDRADLTTGPVSRGDLLAYLSPVVPGHRPSGGGHRVIDRADMQMLLPWAEVG